MHLKNPELFTVSHIPQNIPPLKLTTQKKINVCKPKHREDISFLHNCIRCFVGYSKATTIHGFQYLTESGRSITERTCWVIAMIASLSTCIFLILNTYHKWVSSPIVVTFATSETSVSEIPFPAVTICPEVKSYKYFFNYTDIYLKKVLNHTVAANEMKYFEYMSLICETPPELLNSDNTTVGEEALDYILKVSPRLENYSFDFQWMGYGRRDSAKEFFTPVLTDEGLCHTFNMMDRADLFTKITKFPEDCFSTNGKFSNWFPDTGYQAGMKATAYPLKSSTSGTGGGLSIKLVFVHENFDYICGNGLQGYKVALHQPAQFPLVKENYFRVAHDQSVVAAIKPRMMTTSSDLNEYKPDDRNCYFTSEKVLKYFQVYTQGNCLLECLTNRSLDMCGCVNFYMPKEESTPICAASGKQCLAQAKRVGDTEECDCLPACYSLKFDIETSYAQMNLKERTFIHFQMGDISEEVYQKYIQENRIITAELNLFFKDTLFVRSERNKLFGQSDFWASVGGIMGLFTGFSFLSMCEIVYYITLRIFYNVQIYGRRYWAGPPEKLEGF